MWLKGHFLSKIKIYISIYLSIYQTNAFSDEKQFEELNYNITGFAWFITPFLSILFHLLKLVASVFTTASAR